jgi:hypothetical protein
MADKKVTQLTALTAPANTDLLLIIDDPAGSPVSKKITVEDLFGKTTGVTVGAVNLTATGTAALVADTLTLSSTGTRLTVTQGVIINGSGADSDTRIASDNNANMVYVDASADAVGIGTNTPTEALDVNADAIRVRTAQTPASSNNTAVGWGVGTIAWDSSYLYIAVNATTIKRVPLDSF